MEYLILDGAVLGDQLYEALKFNAPGKCMYEGKQGVQLAAVAPYLLQFVESNGLRNWFENHDLKTSAGMIFKMNGDYKTIYMHLKKFLIVQTEKGKQMYFRFYDPRVILNFLETCDTNQIIEFFGPVDSIKIFSEDKGIVEISQSNGSLIVK